MIALLLCHSPGLICALYTIARTCSVPVACFCIMPWKPYTQPLLSQSSPVCKFRPMALAPLLQSSMPTATSPDQTWQIYFQVTVSILLAKERVPAIDNGCKPASTAGQLMQCVGPTDMQCVSCISLAKMRPDSDSICIRHNKKQVASLKSGLSGAYSSNPSW